MKALFLVMVTMSISYAVYRFAIKSSWLKIRRLKEMQVQNFMTEAIVQDYKVDKDSDGAVTYFRIIQYDFKGEILKTMIEESLKEQPKVGSKVIVYVNDKVPDFVVTDISKGLDRHYLALILAVFLLIIMNTFMILSLIGIIHT